jgi:hypothetical protein
LPKPIDSAVETEKDYRNLKKAKNRKKKSTKKNYEGKPKNQERKPKNRQGKALWSGCTSINLREKT